MVAGSQVLASADDTTAVWAARGALAQGQTLTADDLVEVRVRFADPADAAHYVASDEEFPADPTLARPLGAGELIPVAALGAEEGEETVSVALALPAEEVPHSLAEGSRVDVWVIGGERREAEAEAVLEDVAVLAVPTTSGAFGATGSQQVVLAVPADESDALSAVLAASHDQAVRIVGRAR